MGFRYEEQDANGRLRDKPPSMRSQSPRYGRSRREGARERYEGEPRDRHRREQGDRGYRESQSRLSREQSVSDRGHSPVAAAQLKREAETPTNQIQRINTSAWERSHSPAEYVPYALMPHYADGKNDSTAEKGGANADRITQLPTTQPADEATLIEERRKRREAIKARHRGRATPFSVQALALDATSAPSTPKSTVMTEDNPVQGKLYCF